MGVFINGHHSDGEDILLPSAIGAGVGAPEGETELLALFVVSFGGRDYNIALGTVASAQQALRDIADALPGFEEAWRARKAAGLN